jgi:hypothetical protein
MSMNLNCNTVCLRQTPTHVTDMCMVQADGTVAWELTGKKAKHALWIYIKWLEGYQNSYASSEEANENWKLICAERKSVEKAMKSKKLIVSKV